MLMSARSTEDQLISVLADRVEALKAENASLNASLLDGCTLLYFDIPGRGESIRIALTIAHVQFTDKRLTGDEWRSSFKPTSAWGQLPMLQLKDGTMLAQSTAILRFIGRNTDSYPTDAKLSAHCDEFVDSVDDLANKVNAVGRGLELSEKELKRGEACKAGGEIYAYLQKIDQYVASHGSEGHCIGKSLTIADVLLYAMTSHVVSGFFDGVSEEVLNSFPHIQGCRRMVASIPAVAQKYTTPGPLERAFNSAKDLS